MKKIDADRFQERILDTWWLALVLGGAAIILGIVLFFYPAGSLLWLVRLMGGYWLFAGLAMTVLALLRRAGAALLIRGILGILVGLFVLGHPLLNIDSAPLFLVYLLAISGLITGVVDIVSGLRQRQEMAEPRDWSLVGEGLFSIVISIILLVAPLLSVRIIVLLTAIGSILAGIGLILVSFDSRKVTRR